MSVIGTEVPNGAATGNGLAREANWIKFKEPIRGGGSTASPMLRFHAGGLTANAALVKMLGIKSGGKYDVYQYADNSHVGVVEHPAGYYTAGKLTKTGCLVLKGVELALKDARKKLKAPELKKGDSFVPLPPTVHVGQKSVIAFKVVP